MTLANEHVNVRLRLAHKTEDETNVVQSLNQVRRDIQPNEVSTLMQAIMMIRMAPLNSALMTVTDHLVQR